MNNNELINEIIFNAKKVIEWDRNTIFKSLKALNESIKKYEKFNNLESKLLWLDYGR